MAEHSTADVVTAHEPVLDQARVVTAVTTATPVLFAVLVAFGYQGALDEPATIQAETMAVGAAFALAHWVTVRVAARRVRARVTPTASPTSATGEQLVTVSTATALADRAATAAALCVPVATPWAEDTTLTTAPPAPAGATPIASSGTGGTP